VSRWYPLFTLTAPPIPPEEHDRIREAMADMGWLPFPGAQVQMQTIGTREPRPFRAHTSLGTLGPLQLGSPLLAHAAQAHQSPSASTDPPVIPW